MNRDALLLLAAPRLADVKTTTVTATTAATHHYLSPTGIEIAFVLIGLVVLGSGLLVVTVQNLVHAALWLVVCLGAIAGEFLLLGAELIAWVQVLIYVGAVVVLLLFGLVLTRAPIGHTDELDVKHRLPAVVVALAAAGLLVTVVVDAYKNVWFDPRQAVAAGTAQANGTALFKFWVLPFEALSVLLLAALIGAIALSRREDRTGSAAAGPLSTEGAER
ncbi:MAG TPA: NADH-quinone oxidoreductase subunit J [Actinocrinis sp.]|nr:NADH-quinone oxidoreductase subunit J [Actinocrinis sp.]